MASAVVVKIHLIITLALSESQEEKEALPIPKAISTLWHLGQNLGEERYLTTGLYRLEEQAQQGDVMTSYHLLKKLSSLGSLAQLQSKYKQILLLSWQGKTVESLQYLISPYYERALAGLEEAQDKLSGSEQIAYKLFVLKVQYHYYQLLGPESPKSKDLLAWLTKEIANLNLQKLLESHNLQRIYLSYLVKTTGQMDLQNNRADLRRYIEYIAKQIAKKAKEAAKLTRDTLASEALRKGLSIMEVGAT